MANDRDWIETFKIQQLIYRYSDSVNRGDLEAMRSVYADDALGRAAPRLPSRVRRCVRRILPGEHSAHRAPHPDPALPRRRFARHGLGAGHDDDLRDHEGHGTRDGPLGPKGTAMNYSNFGIYYDELSRIDDEWKFTHRLFVPIYMEPGSVTGDVMTAARSC